MALRPARLLPPKRLLTPRSARRLSTTDRGLLPGAPTLTRTGLAPAGLVQLSGRTTSAPYSKPPRLTSGTADRSPFMRLALITRAFTTSHRLLRLAARAECQDDEVSGVAPAPGRKGRRSAPAGLRGHDPLVGVSVLDRQRDLAGGHSQNLARPALAGGCPRRRGAVPSSGSRDSPRLYGRSTLDVPLIGDLGAAAAGGSVSELDPKDSRCRLSHCQAPREGTFGSFRPRILHRDVPRAGSC